METNRIEVHTPFGIMFAENSDDTHYPGIVICIEQEDGDGKFDKQLALAECTSGMPKIGGHALRLLVWNSDSEDYTNDFTFFEDCPEESEDIIWGKYLQYLHDWAESHNGPGFYGMTPACFEEWCKNEYREEDA